MKGTVKRMNKGKLRHLVASDGVPLLFLLPWLIGTAVFVLYPMCSSFMLSFTNYSFGGNWSFKGIDNFVKMFTVDRRFVHAVQVTLKYVFMAVPIRLTASLLIALMLKKGMRGLSIYRAVYYVPSLLGGSVAISLLWTQIFGSKGLFNQLLIFFGATGLDNMSWITNPNTAINTLIALLVWQFGASMVIFLAGLKQVPESIYEAARIDGAGPTQSFWNITLPMLSPIILFNLVMEMISAFQAFTPAFIISNGKGGVLDSLLFYTLYIYIQGFNEFHMGYASAMAWVLLVVIGIVTGLLFAAANKWVYYDE